MCRTKWEGRLCSSSQPIGACSIGNLITRAHKRVARNDLDYLKTPRENSKRVARNDLKKTVHSRLPCQGKDEELQCKSTHMILRYETRWISN